MRFIDISFYYREKLLLKIDYHDRRFRDRSSAVNREEFFRVNLGHWRITLDLESKPSTTTSCGNLSSPPPAPPVFAIQKFAQLLQH